MTTDVISVLEPTKFISWRKTSSSNDILVYPSKKTTAKSVYFNPAVIFPPLIQKISAVCPAEISIAYTA